MNRLTARTTKWLAQSIVLITILSTMLTQSVQAMPARQSGADNVLPAAVTAFNIDGPGAGQVSAAQTFVAQAFPKGAGESLTYSWKPEPLSGQGTSQAIYAWDIAGKQTVKVTATGADGKGFSADHTISIRPPSPTASDQIEIEMPSAEPVSVGETAIARLLIPAGDLAGFTVVWTPFPDEGQGKPEATFSWNTPGEKNIQATLVSADDTSAKAWTTVTVVDADSAGENLDAEEPITNIFIPSVLNAGGGVQGAQVDEIQIVGGREAEVGAWPWQAALMADPDDANTQFCGGSLIAPDWILTAAHCVDWWSYGTLYAVVGRHSLSTDVGEALPVSQIIIHPDYGSWSGESDIALLRLARSSTATPMSLETLAYQPGDAATVIGWGYTAEGDGSSASDVLMQVEVPMVSNDLCTAAYGGSITNSMICAGQVGVDSCSGDSGGPLMLPGGSTGWTQVGIVSWGYGCAREGYPGVYTKLAIFGQWIQEQMETELQLDDYEPDDDITQATPIPVDGTTQTHSFHVVSDEDWAWFDAIAGETYTVETLNLTGSMDTIIYLYNNYGATLTGNDDGGDESWASKIEWEATYSGRHYVSAHPYSNGSTFNYTYDLRVWRDTYDDDSGPYEPNNMQWLARGISVFSPPQTHTFHFPGDEDWSYFDAAAGTVYRIETSNLSDDNDTVLYLVDEEGNDLIRDDDGGSGLGSRIEWLAVADGPVYIRARHFDPTVWGDEISYDLGVMILPQEGPPALYEPNDNRDSATSIETDGVAQTHDFYIAGDEDWLRFSVATGVTYLIETLNLENDSYTSIQIYGDAESDTESDTEPNVGSPLSGVVDTDEGPPSRQVWTAQENGVHYLRVRPYFIAAGGSETGYDIRISSLGSVPPSPLEPNDSVEQATPIQIGTALVDDFHSANDVDWGSFEAIAGAAYVIETRSLGVASDTVIHLHGPDGSELAMDDDGGVGYASRLVWTAAEAGIYLVRTRQYDQANGPATQYILTVSGATTPADAYEPDENKDTAQPLALDADPQVHNFHQPGDVDWLHFAVEADTAYVVETLNLAEGSDTVLTLVDQSGLVLDRDDDGGGDRGSRIHWRSEAAATFYISVSHFDQRAAGASTQYEIQVRQQSSGEPDAFEADDSLIEASLLTVGEEPQTHNFHAPGDVDWVRFEAAKDADYRIETLNLVEGSDTVLMVVDANGSQLLYDDDGGEGLASSALLTVNESGRYFVGVRHQSESAFGADTQYGLSITQESGSQAGDAFEPDNELGQATLFTPGDSAQTHHFHEAGDDDWIKFDAEVDVTYTITATSLETYGNLTIYLYDQNGNQLAFASNDWSTLNLSVSWTAGYSGNYFVRAQATYSLNYGSETAYEIAVAVGATQPDAYEFDDSRVTARPIETDGTIQSHSFHLQDDTDWVRFDALIGAIYTISTLNLSPDCDTVLQLYDRDEAILALDDESGDGHGSLVEWTATYTGVHYVRVSQYGNIGVGQGVTYDLRVSEALPAETP